MTTVYVAVGSNIEPEVSILLGLERLAGMLSVCAISQFYRTAAVGPAGQPDYLNGVVEIATDLAPLALRDALRRVEAAAGRVRTLDKYAPRTLDLDVILYGQRVLNEDGLVLPSPDIRTRPFVAQPLVELAPRLVLPDTEEPLKDIVARLDITTLQPDTAFSCRVRERILK